MKYIFTIILTVSTFALAGEGMYSPINRALECTVAEVSLYNSKTASTTELNDHNIYKIKQVKSADGTVDASLLKVNNKTFNRTTLDDGVTTYQRGKVLIFKSLGRYYIKKIPSPYTGMLICK